MVNECVINGVRYKIGINGKVFWFIHNDWLLSSKPYSEVKAAIDDIRFGRVAVVPKKRKYKRREGLSV